MQRKILANSGQHPNIHERSMPQIFNSLASAQNTKSQLKKTQRSNILMAASSGSLNLKKFKDKLEDRSHTSKIADTEEEGAFNLFTHVKKRQLEGTKALQLDYKNLRMAILELYLSVKIRSDEEIDGYGKDLFEKEKKEMDDVDGYTLVDLIKGSIEMLMNMRIEDSRPPDDSFDLLNQDIDIELPEGAKAGLKDASQVLYLKTDQMKE